MRIVYYNRLLNEPWGCGVHGRGLVDAWRRNGHEVLCLPYELTSGADRVLSSSMHRAPWLTGWLRPLALDVRGRYRALMSTRRMMSEINAHRPDVVVARRAAYDYVLDRVVTLSAASVVAEVNALMHWEISQLEGEIVAPWEARRELRFLVEANSCVAVSEAVAGQLARIGVDSSRVRVVANGTDVVSFRPDVKPDPEIGSWASRVGDVIAYCGTFAANHDMDTLAEAIRLLHDRSDLGFLFVGPTKEEVASILGPLVSSERVRCTGRVEHAHVPELLACADVYWAAIANDRVSALKLFEYMAMGRPVVLADEQQGRWVVVESGCGICVDRGDSSALARAVQSILVDDSLSDGMGLRGREWVEANGTWASAAEAMLPRVASTTGEL